MSVVGDDFGGEILLESQMGQDRRSFKTQAMFYLLECLFDAPTSVIQLAECYGRQRSVMEQ
jgi:hypothetical protein